MTVSGGTKCLMTLLFIFNFIFMSVGGGILGLGVWIKVTNASWASILSHSAIPYIMIGTGAVITVISFLGTVAACAKSTCMLKLFSVLLLLALIMEITAGVLIYTKSDLVKKSLKTPLLDMLKKYDGIDKTSLIIDLLQLKVKCCGSDSPTDWSTTNWGRGGKKVPISCCNRSSQACGQKSTEGDTIAKLIQAGKIYKSGCIDAVVRLMKDNVWIVGGAGIGVAVIQIVLVIMALCICKKVNLPTNRITPSTNTDAEAIPME